MVHVGAHVRCLPGAGPGTGGLTCFLVPPSGRTLLNALRLQRLKEKLGNRSNASSEVEFHDAFAWRIGEEGRGVRTIIEMVQLTRLDCAVASAGLVRMGLALAMHHARHLDVFQKKLIDQPAMRMVLADLALENEAMTALALRAAHSFDLERRTATRPPMPGSSRRPPSSASARRLRASSTRPWNA